MQAGKAPALTAVAEGITPLLHSDTVVLTAMNAVPWWFFRDSRKVARSATPAPASSARSGLARLHARGRGLYPRPG